MTFAFSNPFQAVPATPTAAFLHADNYAFGAGATTQSIATTTEGVGLTAAALGGTKRYRIFGWEVMPFLGAGSGGIFKFFQTTDDATIRTGNGRAIFEMGMGNAVLTPFIAAIPPTGVPFDPGVGFLITAAVVLVGTDANLTIAVNATALIE